MVPRQLGAGRRLAAAAIAVLAVVLMAAAPALAANRRISISHYAWSDPNIQINLGEHVTWYWIGPDTIHSVTGTGADNQPVDSDPGTDTPRHNIGDKFQVSFDQPGTYEFHCKLHPFVRGTITVSNTPGDPVTEPDPIPKSNVDTKRPYVDGVHLAKSAFGRHGTVLHYGIEEKARLGAEIYRRGKHHLRFAGWRSWDYGHVGNESRNFGGRSKNFDADPGKYRAFITATDKSENVSRQHKVNFTIR